jgi:hypothetical protein
MTGCTLTGTFAPALANGCTATTAAAPGRAYVARYPD